MPAKHAILDTIWFLKPARGDPRLSPLQGVWRKIMAIFLKVPYAEKDQAKSLGARWDASKRLWYVPDGVLLASFERWLPAIALPGNATRVGEVATTLSVTSEGVKKGVRKPRESTPRVDIIEGSVFVGPGYFDTGHDCIPWEYCQQCSELIAKRNATRSE